jgi:hypothetical protein
MGNPYYQLLETGFLLVSLGLSVYMALDQNNLLWYVVAGFLAGMAINNAAVYDSLKKQEPQFELLSAEIIDNSQIEFPNILKTKCFKTMDDAEKWAKEQINISKNWRVIDLRTGLPIKKQ